MKPSITSTTGGWSRLNVTNSDLDFNFYINNEAEKFETLTLTMDELQEHYDPDFSDRYIDYEFVAQGGMGSIFKCRDRYLNRFTAIKTLNENFLQDEDMRIRFIDEARFCARLNFPSVIPTFNLGKNESQHWQIAMKFVDGVSVREIIDRLKRIYDSRYITLAQERDALFQRLDFFLKICECISYCHKNEIIHGDIKPENILITYFGNIYVCDWGCSVPVGTTWETPCGTYHYLSPEFIDDPTTSYSQDIYALGLVLFETVFLQRAGNGCVKKRPAHLENSERGWLDINDPKVFRYNCSNLHPSRRLKAIIQKATHVNPSLRYQTVQEMIQDIYCFIHDRPVSAIKKQWLFIIYFFLKKHQMFAISVLFMFLTSLGTGIFGSFVYLAQLKNQERVEHVKKVKVLEDAYRLTLEVDEQDQFRLNHISKIKNFLQLLVWNHLKVPEEDNCYHFSDYYKNLNGQNENFIFNPVFEREVDLTNALTIYKGQHSEDYPSEKKLARICYYVFSGQDNLMGFYRQCRATSPEVAFQRVDVIWNDRTFYSYPGRVLVDGECKEQLNFYKNKYIIPYFKGGKFQDGIKMDIQDLEGKTVGVLYLSELIEQRYRRILRESLLYPNREYVVITFAGKVLGFKNGEVQEICATQKCSCEHFSYEDLIKLRDESRNKASQTSILHLDQHFIVILPFNKTEEFLIQIVPEFEVLHSQGIKTLRR